MITSRRSVSRSRFFLSAACLLGVVGAVAAFQPAGQPPAQPSQPAPEGRRPGGPGRAGEPTSVDGAMKLMNGSIRRLDRQISDGTKKDENLRFVGEAQRGCLLAKSQPVPERVLKEAKDDAAKAELAAEFRKELISAMRKLLDIEQSLAEGKADAAAAQIEELKKLRDHAHQEMGVEED